MPIMDLLGIPAFVIVHLHARVFDFILDGRWVLEDRFRARFPNLCFRIEKIDISPVADYLWIFDGNPVDFKAALSLVWRSVYDMNCLRIGCMRNCVDDLLILRRFGLSGHLGKAPVIRSVVWSPPTPGRIKVNMDGAVLGSPGVGGVFRTGRSFVKACFAVLLGQVFAFEAELLVASLAINYAWNLG
ncbi:hypothetical protein LWI28_002883 [Acer negundo]|uniref:RNase H type-1 domain-containing protein n=1 Tax=Acer negundo TaxID=4023 RepID=A0AAD5IYC0_ACENE|nr:hypothetical protein LWI28_002883 [Acer negundo]